jgi:hypothetical protein
VRGRLASVARSPAGRGAGQLSSPSHTARERDAHAPHSHPRAALPLTPPLAGENDCNGNACNPAGFPKITAAFVSFVSYLSAGYKAADPGAELTFFLAIAPHEKGQSAAILPAVTQLTAAGFNVHFLNATVPSSPSVPSGCGGHPGPTIHKLAAARAYPVIAAAMGWN